MALASILLRVKGVGRHRSDAELVAASLAGDVVAFTEIVERYQQLVCAISYSACGDVGLSEDVAQEVFVTAWRELARLRDPARLKGWLCSVARDVGRDATRRRRREVVSQPDSDLDREVDGGPSPLESAAASQREDVVWAALAEIPESYREPLVLFYREDRSLKQVAASLGLTVTTVKQRLSRGRKALRSSLAPVAAALLDSAPGKTFTASVIAAALVRPGLAEAAGSRAETLTAGEAVARPTAVAAIGGATRLAAGAALAAVAVGVLWFLARPGDEPLPRREVVESFAASEHKELPTLYAPGAEAADRGGAHSVEGAVVDGLGNPVAGAVVTVSGKPPRSVITGDDGRFRIAGLAARVYGVDAHTRGGAAPPLAVRVGELTEPITLRIEAGSTLEITAIDGATDAAMSGVEVELRSEIRGSVARTGERGTARFEGIAAHESEVSLRAPGYAPMRVTVTLSGQPGLNRRRLVLRRGEPVSGRVVDPDGRPVAGASIYLDGGVKLMAYDHRGVETGDDGRFAIDAVALGSYVVRVDHPSWQNGQVDVEVGGGPVDGIEIQLERGASIRGRVLRADGSPAAGAEVSALSAVAEKRTTTSATGEFVLDGLPPRRISLTAESYPETAEPIDVDPTSGGAAPVTIRLAPSCIRGRVVDGAGEPIRGGRVRALSWKADAYMLHQSVDRTDSRGRFALCRLQRGVDYDITAIAEGVPLFFLYDEGSALSARPGDGRTHTVRLERPGAVVGEVARPAPKEFAVSITRDLRGHTSMVSVPFAGTGGEFAITRVPPGSYAVVVSAEGRIPSVHRRVEVRPGGVVELAPSVLGEPATIRGAVVDAGGAPVAGAVVHAGVGLQGSGREVVEFPEGGDIDGDPNGPRHGVYKGRTDERGRFAIEVHERTGSSLVAIAEHPRLGRSAPAVARVGSAGEPQLELVPAASLSGRVLGPRPGMVSAWALGPDGSPLDVWVIAELTPDGRYHLETLGAGSWIVAASGVDDMPSASADGAVRIELAPGERARRALDVAAPAPPWTEDALAELDRIAVGACDCDAGDASAASDANAAGDEGNEACRRDAERRFRAYIRSRRMPEAAEMARTEAAIEVFERCLGLR